MKRIIMLFILLSFLKSLSQNVVVVDITNNKPLPFVAVKFDNKGFYTSSKGKFNIKQIPSDSIELNYLGYKKLKTNISIIKDTVFLTPNTTLLDEVILPSKKKNRITKRVIKPNKPNSFSSWVLFPNTELLMSIYPTKKTSDFNIDKITIPLAEISKNKNLRNKEIVAYLRLNIYKIKDGKPSVVIFRSQPKSVNTYQKTKILFNLTDNFITLNKEGLFIGVEMIGYYLNDKEVKSIKFIRPLLTKKIKDLKVETFLKYTFENTTKLVKFNEIFLQKAKILDKKFIRNLNIEIELSK